MTIGSVINLNVVFREAMVVAAVKLFFSIVRLLMIFFVLPVVIWAAIKTKKYLAEQMCAR